jgi:DNA-binding transcriptional LysR family regulator
MAQCLGMVDLNDLRIFEKVGSLRSFSAAARELSQPKSNISRGVARLEAALGTRLIQRTTRKVELTRSGESLLARCASALGQLGQALDFVGSLAAEPHGELRVSAGIGFGINVLSEQLPSFIRSFPNVNVMLDLTSRPAELVAERVDVAIRLGPLPDSSLVAVRLGEMRRILCAAPAYLERKGTPRNLEDLAGHDVIEMPGLDGRPRTWSFIKDGRTTEVDVVPRICVNDALTINRLIMNEAGMGIVSCYLCANEIAAGRLVHLLPEWTAPPVPVSLVFPSKRELAPAVRTFVDFMREANPPGFHWQNNELPKGLKEGSAANCLDTT